MSKRIFPILALALSLAACSAPQRAVEVTLSEQELYDKIRGGWAGQTIGVVFGAPTEFKFTGTTIQDYQPIPWSEHYVKYWWDKKPGLFDDIYNDLTFVETFEQEGLDCTTETLARRFAFAEYHLAHANQAGRYNIRNGIMPPASGNWVNNPHADDLDFQIEADFIGLMAPGLMSEALDIASRVGHIMNSGDGFYGGAFVAGLYAAAFISNDPAEVLDMALEPIPHQSTFYQCVDEVRRLYREYPDDWQQCWFEMHKRWNRDVGCPKGVFLSFNIDAKINAAYVAIGLLYGGGDFARSMEIATRCGQDSDCNPASAAGILGTAMGYDAIPSEWRTPVERTEDLKFAYTDMSLGDVYRTSFKHALENISRHGGTVGDTQVVIRTQKPRPVKYEQSFGDLRPVERIQIDQRPRSGYSMEADCEGIVIRGDVSCEDKLYEARIEIEVDGRKVDTFAMPADWNRRRHEIWWRFDLKAGQHTITIHWTNPRDDAALYVRDALLLRKQ